LVLYPNRMHVVSVEGTGVIRFADLKGKRVSTGSPGSATEVMAFRAIEALGLDRDRDMRRERLGAAESVGALKDKKIDAFFWVGGLPTGAVSDLANTPNTKIKMVDHSEAVAGMNKKFGPLYVEDTIPRTTYRGMDADNKIATVWNILVTHEKMSDQAAYNIVKTIFEKRADLIAVHSEAENIKLEYQKNVTTPIPFHPGAIRYISERGGKLN
jgi:TRAP transporter TAXI family solute receptor